jgi:uncharacterized protein
VDVLLDQPPWFVAGPAIGLVVVATLVVLDARLAVSGGYAQLVDRLTRRSRALGWKGWFVVGVVGGGVVFAAAAGSWGGDATGWLGRAFGGVGAGAGLLLGGALIGYGARASGGCTSGHGLSGTSFGSRSSFVATMVFMATAVAAAFATRWAFGA